MKNRIEKLRQIELSGKIGQCEGVFVTPMVAKKLLTVVDNVRLATENLYKLCKSVSA